jgi:hypothetical protein
MSYDDGRSVGLIIDERDSWSILRRCCIGLETSLSFISFVDIDDVGRVIFLDASNVSIYDEWRLVGGLGVGCRYRLVSIGVAEIEKRGILWMNT